MKMFPMSGTLIVAITVCGAWPLVARSESKSIVESRQVGAINDALKKSWAEWEVTPSRHATDGEWCRRVFLDLIGRVPSVQELRDFLRDRDDSKRQKLVAKLLYDEQYTEEYARNWTTIWTNVLIGRSGGTERNSLTSRAGMQKYLRDTFARNKPYDRMVFELVTATGNTQPGTEDFNGATNFLSMKVNDEKGTLATAATSKIFLGLQVQCTQCHNHPFNEWKQQKFWEMNAFFRQTRSLRRFAPGTRDVVAAELVNEDFAGEGTSRTPQNAEIYYEQRNGFTNVAYPVFVDGTEVPTSGYVSDVVRREKLAEQMLKVTDETKPNYLEKMIVNRMWAHFLGYGFTKPIDDMGPHNPPSHPELVDYLGLEFRDNSYDLKKLASWIVLSEPYALSSRTNKTNVKLDDPAIGETPKFSRFYLRQMRAEELYESLLVVTQAHKTRGSFEQQEQAKTQWLRQFTVAFGNDEGEEATTFNGTIPQALMMFNGDLIQRATGAEAGGFLHKIATSQLSPREKINYLFQAALSRNATKKEVSVANALLAQRSLDQRASGGRNNNRRNNNRGNNTIPAGVAALQDMWWAMLNSNEFILNH